jgi:hypothetical protein
MRCLPPFFTVELKGLIADVLVSGDASVRFLGNRECCATVDVAKRGGVVGRWRLLLGDAA